MIETFEEFEELPIGTIVLLGVPDYYHKTVAQKGEAGWYVPALDEPFDGERIFVSELIEVIWRPEEV